MDNTYLLYQPFNVEIHKANFINYLEVVILEDGIVEYAVPSHQGKLINICCKKLNIDKETLNKMCPPEYYCDFTYWLCMVSGCVSVWNKFILGKCNDRQLQTLKELKENGLYEGEM